MPALVPALAPIAEATKTRLLLAALQKPIYHNAGATRDKPELFYKGDWINKSPIGEDITTKAGSASAQYVNAITDVKFYKPKQIS